MTRVLLVRHGETDGNRTKTLQLPTIPLNETGHRQARKAAERIGKSFKVHRILCSDLVSRRDLARRPIGEATGKEVELSPLLQERSFGDLRGKTYAELESSQITLFHPDYHPPNGESWDMFKRRGDEAWQLILSTAQDTPQDHVLVVVTHGLVLHHVLSKYVQVPEEYRQHKLLPFRNTSLTWVDVAQGSVPFPLVQGMFNDDSHLDDSDRDPNFAMINAKS
ncbi:Probable phosphoglycerate mutase GpmB (PGAM) (Phosphoglyceromutase) [Durusdinium trenchii]|uniref:Probable phosphoglycerate mutase GpmB (PGAM) (Phosphoglyceromutase) n=1 Tax=Durusdinium trenchii TaxID=1381693 RepID=A0ABP0IFE6_9DINO